MALRDWISRSGRSATATVATPATLETSGAVTVATVATVAVASVKKDYIENRGLTPVLDGLHPCPLCGGGLFNEGSRGGYFCVACQSLSEGEHVVRVVRGITPRKPQKIYPEPVPAVSKKQQRHLPSLIALQWIRDHCQELDAAGWSRPDLYRRSGYRPGLVWYAPWTKASSISLDQATGAIVFIRVSGGREIVQRAYLHPQKQTVTGVSINKKTKTKKNSNNLEDIMALPEPFLVWQHTGDCAAASGQGQGRGSRAHLNR